MPQPCRTSLLHTARTPEAQGSSFSLSVGAHGTLVARATVHGLLDTMCMAANRLAVPRCRASHAYHAPQVDGSRPVILTGALPPVLKAAAQWVEDVAVRCQPNVSRCNAMCSGCVSDWPALSWTHAYLREKLGAAPVHVALTPDGLGDAVKQHDGQLVFAKPHEALMPFAAFLDALETPLRAPPPSAPPPSAEVARRVGELRVGEAEGVGEADRDEGGGEGKGEGKGEGEGEGEGEGVLRRAVHYCSHQNSSLTEEFEELQADWRPLAWADAAFGW